MSDHTGPDATEGDSTPSRDDFEVVRNDEEQYSVWPADEPAPSGWTLVGFRGPKEACLDHIEQVWTDMRPLSVRRWLQGLEAQG